LPARLDEKRTEPLFFAERAIKVQSPETERREIVVETQLRNQEDWSYLANKVVGAEGE
jgi:hypothetical protein